jgi:type VI secretion system protein ImpI
MSLLLTLEQGPRGQAIRQTRLDKGELSIGRSPEADWQIEDPDMFVSRTHCRIRSEPDGYIVTDMSSSGLFIDDSEHPLGTGNSVRLKNGMRLRMGDYVLGVEVQSPTGQAAARGTAPLRLPPASHDSITFSRDDFFSSGGEEEPSPPRPSSLPDPFDQFGPSSFHRESREESAPRSAAFDDPFSLDPVATPKTGKEADWSAPISFDDGFGTEPPKASTPARHSEPASASSHAPWELPGAEEVQPAPKPTPVAAPSAQSRAKSHLRQSTPSQVASDELLAAFMRGAGMDGTDLAASDPAVLMEKFGREYRLMLAGLMQLLRKRAEEKGNARLEQTVVGTSEVNPLKFLPTVDDALATIFSARSPGFLDGETAIADAVKSLAQHHIRAWRGVQGALRSMIDRFDPAAIEEELKSDSTLGALLSGSRGSRLWELYRKRHQEIARSAEERFLGEIGADFRDAYEEERNNDRPT